MSKRVKHGFRKLSKTRRLGAELQVLEARNLELEHKAKALDDLRSAMDQTLMSVSAELHRVRARNADLENWRRYGEKVMPLRAIGVSESVVDLSPLPEKEKARLRKQLKAAADKARKSKPTGTTWPKAKVRRVFKKFVKAKLRSKK